jgi:cbb3-type cytochrome oxidase maturation protein
MEVLFVLLPLALTFAATAVGVFLWAARSGQFDDLTTPAVRMLHDDVPARGPAAPPRAETDGGAPWADRRG